MRRRRKRSSLPIVVAVLVATLMIAALTVLIVFMSGRPYSKVILRAGQPMIAASDFFKKGGAATFVQNEVDIKIPGEYKIKLKKGFFTYGSLVVVVDEEAPVVDYFSEYTVNCGDRLSAETLIKSVVESSNYEICWVHEPETSLMGYTSAEVSVKDAGGNETKFTTKIHVVDANVILSHTIEVGETISETEFFKDGNALGEIFTLTPSLEEADFSRIGAYTYVMNIHNDAYTIVVNVKDTVAPVATAVDKKVKKGSTPKADRFIKDIVDKTAVSVSYAETPDFSQEGTVTVKLILTDEGGNSTGYEAHAEVGVDTEAPVISGDTERNIYIGDDMSLLSGVTGMDEYDGEVVVYVEKDNVKFDVVGDYAVTYWAEDEEGNKTVVPGMVHVYGSRSDDEKFHQMYEAYAAKIIKDDMTDREKAQAIYDDWHYNSAYLGVSNVRNKDNWRLEAIYALEKRSGDCYTDFAFAKAMFETVGIPTMDVERMWPNKRGSHHYWLLVYVEDKWYQFDAGLRITKFDGCLFTKAEGLDYNTKVRDYYLFDESLYPDIEIQ